MTFEEYVESERREVRYEMRGEIEKLHEVLDAKDEEINVVISERDSMKEELNAKDKEINTAFRERDAALHRVAELEKMLKTR